MVRSHYREAAAVGANKTVNDSKSRQVVNNFSPSYNTKASVSTGFTVELKNDKYMYKEASKKILKPLKGFKTIEELLFCGLEYQGLGGN
ncbi:hypothetical protein TNIN_166441 [Trichonephila inaurata madagascariensis]|uniref:Uncharacterized protein n=1 Tax=Trichonephila inaurata madagascariensis TaxID=2747483 RepID=A0A8X6XR28_9ARAC|nr:hypothetical protein TNIN_166441 [Trichonephila inaurata madagascariensis]